MGDSRQRIDHRPDPQPQRRADRHFYQAKENQHDRRIFDEIGVRPHPPGQQRIPRVAVQKLRAHADSRAAHRQPEIDERLDMKHTPRVANTAYHDLLTEEIWEIAGKVQALDFKKLRSVCTKKAIQIYNDILNNTFSVADTTI